MAEVNHWYTVDDEGNETGPFTDYAEAERKAHKWSEAIKEYTYEYSDSTIVWTPDGSGEWPPNDG